LSGYLYEGVGWGSGLLWTSIFEVEKNAREALGEINTQLDAITSSGYYCDHQIGFSSSKTTNVGFFPLLVMISVGGELNGPRPTCLI
jgi:hypothetical protein